jgi:hypothetical protein
VPLQQLSVDVAATREALAKQMLIDASAEAPAVKKKKIRELGLSKDAPTQMSAWFGQDGARPGEFVTDPLADLAVVKLVNFDATGITAFPRFKRLHPEDRTPQGRSLLKIGYPFAAVKTEFIESTNTFQMDTDGIAMFPIDGILTRTVRVVDHSSGRDAFFLETSTPGLKGQSGGPTVDVHGVVWAVQSQTTTQDLDFIGRNAKDAVRQFISLGMGAHPINIKTVLDTAGVEVEWID